MTFTLSKVTTGGQLRMTESSGSMLLPTSQIGNPRRDRERLKRSFSPFPKGFPISWACTLLIRDGAVHYVLIRCTPPSAGTGHHRDEGRQKKKNK